MSTGRDRLVRPVAGGVMSESLQTRILRWGFNLFPAFRRTGGRITYISHDLAQVRIRLPLNWKTRNYVRTLYCGCMYAAIDPVYMVMLMKLLGSDSVVWDKTATIQYKRPGRSSLHAAFRVSDEELAHIRDQLERNDTLERSYQVELLDEDNRLTALIEKTLHICKRSGTRAT